MSYKKPSKDEIQKKLNTIQYAVTQNSATEVPFQNDYWNHFEKGLYVDVVTGEPLFTSNEKYDASCGWPSFSKPIRKENIRYVEDYSLNLVRIEVRSQVGDSHLGHVFDDGPEATGGMRYCINSAALRFIPYEALEAEGYSEYLDLFETSEKEKAL
ncbi:peptide-methionine (R)-S-oxide reductase MsrB [Fusibacter sp. JL298sf-3]